MNKFRNLSIGTCDASLKRTCMQWEVTVQFICSVPAVLHPFPSHSWNKYKSGGQMFSAKRRTKFFVVLLHFLAIQVQSVLLESAFMMVSTVWFAVFLLPVPPDAQPFVKVGACAPPPCPMETAPVATAQSIQVSVTVQISSATPDICCLFSRTCCAE